MTMFSLAALLLGAALGMRFNVFVLGPALVGLSMFGLAVAWAQGGGTWSIFVFLAAAVAALQAGYLMGAMLRLLTADVPEHAATRMVVGQNSRANR